MASLITQIGRKCNGKVFSVIMILLIVIMHIVINRNRAKTTTKTKLYQDYLDKYENENSELESHLFAFATWMDDLEVESVTDKESRRERCPFCYGDDLCDDLQNGEIRVDPDVKKRRRYGMWAGQYSLVRFACPQVISKLEGYVCKTMSKEPGCDVPELLMSDASFVLKDESFLPQNMADVARSIHAGADAYHLLTCANSKLIAELSASFDPDSTGSLSKEQTLMFWFSIITNPSSIIYRFIIDKFEIMLPVSEHFGACGHVVVQEAVGNNLTYFLGESWQFRANLGFQVIDIIDQLLIGDGSWAIAHGNLSNDAFGVNENGEVMLIDLDNLILKEKLEQEGDAADGVTLCNYEDCLKPYLRKMSNFECQGSDVDVYEANLMYLSACLMLSDDEAHRNVIPGRAWNKGILSDPPEEHAKNIALYLQECVIETKPGGRKEAADSLKLLLGYYGDDYSAEDYDTDQQDDKNEQ